MATPPTELQQVRDLVFRRAGIVLDTSKDYLIEARLGALARELQIDSTSALISKLSNREIERSVVEAMTTNETSFFRDITPFDFLKKSVFPIISKRLPSDNKLAIWCAASSTGQEPYTLAMTLMEAFPRVQDWKITFIASDLSRDVLERARAGRYSQLEVNRGLPAALLVKYFKKIGNEWEIREDLRKMIDFREINLLESWPSMPPLDLVFIRNVLIYFNVETKKKILGRIRGLMRPESFLFLGGAETTLNVDDNFDRMQADKGSCYRVKTASSIAA